MQVSKKANKTRFKISSLINSVVILSILATVFVQFFIESGSYSVLRMALYMLFLFAFLLIVVFRKTERSNSFIKVYLVAIYLATIVSFLIGLYTNQMKLATLIAFVLPVLLIQMGYSSGFSKNQMNGLILKYMILVSLLGLFVIFKYGSGFQITSQYFFSSKNQVGPFIASTVMMSLISILERTSLNLKKKVLIPIFAINFSTLLVLRNRSGLVAFGVCLLVYFVSNLKFKRKFKKEVLLTPILMLVGIPILIKSKVLLLISNLLNQSFLKNYNVSDLNSLSAGRFDIYINVMEYIKTSPFFGEIAVESAISETPHNFLLNLWLNYGVFGMLPITIFYIYTWIFILRRIIIKKEVDVSLYLILFMLVISLFEYTYPFSPLTTVSLSWFLLGSYLNEEQLNHNDKFLKIILP